MTSRQTILDLLSGKKIDTQPAFSGLIHITAEGVQSAGLTFQEAHHEAQKMANAAASTFRLTGMPSAALPLDLCAPAEALGASLNFYEDREYQFPQPAKPLFASAKYLSSAYFESADFLTRGRLPFICGAIRLLKQEIGEEVVISGIILFGFGLLGEMIAGMQEETREMGRALTRLDKFDLRD